MMYSCPSAMLHMGHQEKGMSSLLSLQLLLPKKGTPSPQEWQIVFFFL